MAGTTRQTRSAGDGRERLLDTAERLIDELGIDGCSSRAIAAAAGHRNVAAVNYHFRNKHQLLLAVWDRRRDAIEAERHARLDVLEAAGPVDPSDALSALIAPLVTMLDKLEGRRYLRLLGQSANHPTYYTELHGRSTTAILRGVTHLEPAVAHLEEPRRITRLRLALGLVIYAMAEQARLLDNDAPPRPALDTATFSADIVSAAIGALRAP